MKNTIKFIGVTLASVIIFFVVSALLPYSPGFMAANENTDPLSALYFLPINGFFVAIVAYIVRNSSWSKLKILAFGYFIAW